MTNQRVNVNIKELILILGTVLYSFLQILWSAYGYHAIYYIRKGELNTRHSSGNPILESLFLWSAVTLIIFIPSLVISKINRNIPRVLLAVGWNIFVFIVRMIMYLGVIVGRLYPDTIDDTTDSVSIWLLIVFLLFNTLMISLGTTKPKTSYSQQY
jgi:hypothetical protein